MRQARLEVGRSRPRGRFALGVVLRVGTRCGFDELDPRRSELALAFVTDCQRVHGARRGIQAKALREFRAGARIVAVFEERLAFLEQRFGKWRVANIGRARDAGTREYGRENKRARREAPTKEHCARTIAKFFPRRSGCYTGGGMRRHGSPHAGRGTGARVVFGVSVVSLAACAQVLGVDDVGSRFDVGGAPAAAGDGAVGGGGRSIQAGTAGQAAPGASAGRSSGVGGSGGHSVARGGSGGRVSMATAGGEPNGGEPNGGEPNGGEPNGGEPNGTGGEAGAPGPSVGRVVNGTAPPGTLCLQDRQYACSSENPLEVLRCDQGSWAYNLSCELDERCDLTAASAPSTPAALCTALDPSCYTLAPNGPVCVDNTAYDCGPRVYTAQEHVCPFGCANGACELGTASELTLHTGIVQSLGSWPSSISVCLSTTDADEPADSTMFGWMKSEVEHVYDRFFQVEFVDWARCETGSMGVIVSFEDDCAGHLVSDIPFVWAGSDHPVLPVTLCRTYVDPVGVEHKAYEDESLVRLLARHQFGHVLGLPDGPGADPTGMQRGVESDQVDALVLTPEDYVALATNDGAYASKPQKSLVTPAGQCLSASTLTGTDTSTVAATACTTATEQRWQAKADRIQSPDALTCVQAGASGDPVAVAPCATPSSQTFRLAHAQWRTPTRCVAPAQKPPVEGTKLTTEPCTAAGDPSQAWYFELTGVDPSPAAYPTARIHCGDSGLCAAMPRAQALLNDELRLLPCATAVVDGDPQIFTLENGLVFNNGNYVTWQDPPGVLYVAAWSGYATFFASGAFETADGRALTLSPDSTLTTTPLAALPTPAQVFDVYF